MGVGFSRTTAGSGVWHAGLLVSGSTHCLPGLLRSRGRCAVPGLVGWESEIAHTCSALGEAAPPASAHFICTGVKDSSVPSSWVTFSLRLLIYRPLGLQAELGECVRGRGGCRPGRC